ncbi:LpxI family protein [Paenochrobactrum sp. BZR 588]|uniref:LpxI family protein n=1 Tax=Paenochrobactrum TaxID=999488 RepID=UPI0035BC5FE6
MTSNNRLPVTDQSVSPRTAIIAGNGLLPIEVAKSLSANGNPPFIFALRGEAAPELYQFEHQELSIVEFAKFIKGMKSRNISQVILAGGVLNRPHLSDLRFDMPTLRALPKVIGALGKGDDALLRAFIRLLEGYDIKVIGAHEIVPDLLSPTPSQCLTIAHPDKREQENIRLGAEAARLLGDLDVGQGGVAVGGRVVALEGAEGTDLMLLRVAELRASGRIPPRGGVLVKCAKPSQEERADLPAIGVMTVVNADKAGLAGIAVEAGRSFVLGYQETINEANKRGLFIETFVRTPAE